MKTLFTFIVSAFLFSACSQGNAQENITVSELNAIEFNSDDSKVVLDVRTAQEYAEGKIAGSKNLDVLKTDLFTTSIEKLDKNKTYYVICRSGSRSLKAANQMKEAGFKNVVNISGGMQAWEAANFPVEK
ncbi:rhodanese-like domain-containing protein [Marivirga salinae]|uniref:Rhodanese-like domain-containing protein n=1 Tax=Marivirga salinarum TaxID=3059078 RepID=A0AA51RDV3_9BACT|nr:rhodanese-like domain-containing protein [Marivirga sp. BDSF4-3]WMN11159.1 rhodanese-like domain-containing protein [Marivirga sp. BDSF4-3]